MKVEGSGRKKGTKNRDTQSLEEKVEVLGFDPFEALLLFAQGNKEQLELEDIPAELRFKAIKEVCSFLYPKRKSIEVLNVQERQVESIEDFLFRLERS